MDKRVTLIRDGIAAISLACLSVAVPGKMILPGALLGGLHPETLELLIGAVALVVIAVTAGMLIAGSKRGAAPAAPEDDAAPSDS